MQTLNCVGEALTQIKNLEQDTNSRGFKAWHRATKEYRGTSVQRLVGLVEKVYAPTRAPDLNDLTGHIEDWEMAVADYGRIKDDVAVNHKVPELVKVWALRKLVPKELEQDLERMCQTLRTLTRMTRPSWKNRSR